ncbi:MAG: cation:proton antiporter [Bacteroidetes bacterium]|nr:cation:proton antiporter [Bacteroidota bacterium]
MDAVKIIQDIVIILAVSLPIIFIFKRLHIPSIVGFLIAGMIIGPFGFKLIKGINQIEVMAEVGVILLLFTIGLEVSFSQFKKIKRFLLIAGGFQVIGTIIFGALLFTLFIPSINQAIFLGMLLSLSSTAIVLKLLSERGELYSPQGKISLGILIFQDLAIVPMFFLLPLLKEDSSLSFTDVSIKLLVAFGALATILILSKFLIPKMMYQLAKLRMKDAFTIGTILILLGSAYLTHSLGLSFALGAFIAGLILAESDYHSQILSDMLPLKDAFNSIFFVSVGLLLNIQFVFDFPLLIIGATIAVILLKSSIIILVVLYLKYPFRIALVTGLGLAQIGEFAFVLAQAGTGFNLISGPYYNVFLATSIFTMILTPFLIKLSPMLGFISNEILAVKSTADESIEKLKGHVIIAGYGLNGRNLSRVLKETGIKYVIIEMNPETVKIEKAKGESIVYGDISKEEVLKSVNIEGANTLVFSISDPITTKRALSTVKRLNPKLYIVVRTRFVSEIEELNKLGADSIIPEEFETSLEIFRKVLQNYHIPLNIIMKQAALLRQESYMLLREPEAISSFIHLDEILAEGITETYYVNEDNPHSNRSLSEIHLRAETEATIIAIVRDGKTISNPTGKESILAHDTLVITGTHQSVDKAINILNGQPL